MKTFTFVQVLLIIVLLLAYQCTQAQDYAVSVRGDTLAGKVKLFNYGPDKKVQVQSDGKKKETLSLTQTRTVFYQGEFYRPQKGPNGYSYMKLVKDGFLSLYAFQPENQMAFDGLLLVKRDGSAMEVPNLSFKKAVTRFLQDCPTVSNRVDAGEYDRKDLHVIVDAYNTCSTGSVPIAAVTPSSSDQKESAVWNELEESVRGHSDFSGKQDALDMITEIKNKIRRGEKVPKFMVEGLRSSLANTSLGDKLEAALNQLG